MAPLIRIESDFVVPFPRAQIWPILSKTDWINRALGLPPVTYQLEPLREGGSSIKARARLLGWELRWQEVAFEWTENEFYRVHRVFETGPFAEAHLGVDFRVKEPESTLVHAYSHITPRNALSAWISRSVIGPKTTGDFRRIIEQVTRHLQGKARIPIPKLPVSRVAESPLQGGLAKLRETGQPEDLIQHMERFIRQRPDVEISHIRPFAVARMWDRDRWKVLDLFLHATRAGLLDLSWEILCPNCRSTRLPPATSLKEVHRTSHCEVCQIKYDAEFDKSVELKFAVSPAIRLGDRQMFCLAGPGGKPHVVSQLRLAPGQRCAWQMPERTRPHRLRSPQVKESVTLKASESLRPLDQPIVICRPDAFEVRFEARTSEDFAMQIFNPNEFPVQLFLEKMEWSEDILTAARVTNWQDFRDLFAAEIISPHEQITVGSQVVLFTDLSGSTAMYNRVGDAPAYVLVRNHFAILTQAVQEHHGGIVKTIGDAVMAVFSQVGDALKAVREMHEKLPAANPNPSAEGRLSLKSSLHLGSCLAVNANDKLDFFGTTINLAARMVTCCKGGDLTLSDELYQRSETADFLRALGKTAVPSEVTFRGFEKPHKVWRVPIV